MQDMPAFRFYPPIPSPLLCGRRRRERRCCRRDGAAAHVIPPRSWPLSPPAWRLKKGGGYHLSAHVKPVLQNHPTLISGARHVAHQKSAHAPHSASTSSPFVHSLRRGLSQALPYRGPPRIPAPLGPGRGRWHCGLAAHAWSKKSQAAEGAKGGPGRQQDRSAPHRLHPLLGGLRCGCRGGKRRVGAPGPVFDSPINLGAHCAKGCSPARARPRRIPPALPHEAGQNGRVRAHQLGYGPDRISAKMLELRKASGPDSVYFIGSSKHNNEQAYLLRKFVSFWGSNNCDHQARICHSTTVAGVANTWGYGAMTNSYNDMQNSNRSLCTSAQRG